MKIKFPSSKSFFRIFASESFEIMRKKGENYEKKGERGRIAKALAKASNNLTETRNGGSLPFVHIHAVNNNTGRKFNAVKSAGLTENGDSVYA